MATRDIPVATARGGSKTSRWTAPNELVALTKPKRVKCATESEEQDIGVSVQGSASAQATVDNYSNIGLRSTDWSLKSRIRLRSEKEFTWLHSSRPHHEAQAFSTLDFRKCKELPTTLTLDDLLVLFHQSRIVWVHPSYPPMDIFPRMEDKATHSYNSPNLSEKDAMALRQQWTTAFNSVFQLLQCGHIPYFYVCADVATILFISNSVVPPHGIALLTPTTPGFRNAMRREGITYEMSLAETHSTAAVKDEELEGPDGWLVGATSNTKHSLNPATSSVSIKGTEFCALVNFILNHKTLVSSNGKFANIPPTLLSPMQFLGATMQALKVKRNKVQEAAAEDGELRDIYYTDISGPILPHAVQKQYTIANLKKHTIQFQDHKQTSVFKDFLKEI